MKKLTKGKKVVIVVLAVVLGIVGGVFGYSYYQLSKIKTVKLSNSDNDLGIDMDAVKKARKNPEAKEANVVNYLLLGVDKEEQASDSIIVMSVDYDRNKVKLTSIARDSYIEFGQDKVNKLNYAYHYGGPQLAIKTINENYHLDIRNFVKVNFEGLTKIIDTLGGIRINIRDYEVPSLAYVGITKTGTQTLSGKQALAYSRLRKVGNGDFERTERQREVLNQIFSKMTSTSKAKLPGVITSMFPYIETSLDKGDIIKLATGMPDLGHTKLEELRIPLTKDVKVEYINGIFYYKWEKQPTIDILHDFIYNDIKPQ